MAVALGLRTSAWLHGSALSAIVASRLRSHTLPLGSAASIVIAKLASNATMLGGDGASPRHSTASPLCSAAAITIASLALSLPTLLRPVEAMGVAGSCRLVHSFR